MKIPNEQQIAGLALAKRLLEQYNEPWADSAIKNPAMTAADWIAELLDCLDHTVSIERPCNGAIGCTGCPFLRPGRELWRCALPAWLTLDDDAGAPEATLEGPLPELCPLRLGWRVVMGACEVRP